ncbi:uncharacterized protein LOC107039558 [Diachasma alloeum]|uniref:uncharacterized protein LOC107039558 n=1 Tax=Diachasma alloeum TaxID=454923 RepID=UPI0007381670|nr:uncharacterized protein LOC107039558 [Diachasma alloeum]XP_015114727.1 uncharacterized protein LOC107039558 [Diachasma alloeum]
MSSSILRALFLLAVVSMNHQHASSKVIEISQEEVAMEVIPEPVPEPVPELVPELGPVGVYDIAEGNYFNNIIRQKAVTDIGRQHLHLEWTIKNYTRLNHQQGGCVNSPNFQTGDKNSNWRVKFCLRDGMDAKFFVRLHLSKDTPGLSHLHRQIDGELAIFKSGEKLASKKFDKIGVSLKQESHTYEYADEAVELLPRSSPADTVTIVLHIDMPQKTLTKLFDIVD